MCGMAKSMMERSVSCMRLNEPFEVQSMKMMIYIYIHRPFHKSWQLFYIFRIPKYAVISIYMFENMLYTVWYAITTVLLSALVASRQHMQKLVS